MVERMQAVVDTGFWGLCCRLHVEQYLTTVWANPILMPGAVIAEIFAAPALSQAITGHGGATLFPDQQKFLDAFLAEMVHPENADHNYITGFDWGER